MIFFQDISINLGSIVSFIILKDSIKVLIVGDFARGNFPVPDKKTILQKISHYSCYIFISQSILHMFDLTITFHTKHQHFLFGWVFRSWSKWSENESFLPIKETLYIQDLLQKVRACMRFFRKRVKKGKIFENLGKKAQSLRIFWKRAGGCMQLPHSINSHLKHWY